MKTFRIWQTSENYQVQKLESRYIAGKPVGWFGFGLEEPGFMTYSYKTVKSFKTLKEARKHVEYLELVEHGGREVE